MLASVASPRVSTASDAGVIPRTIGVSASEKTANGTPVSTG